MQIELIRQFLFLAVCSRRRCKQVASISVTKFLIICIHKATADCHSQKIFVVFEMVNILLLGSAESASSSSPASTRVEREKNGVEAPTAAVDAQSNGDNNAAAGYLPAAASSAESTPRVAETNGMISAIRCETAPDASSAENEAYDAAELPPPLDGAAAVAPPLDAGARRTYLTERLTQSLEAVAPLLREIMGDFRSFLQKTLLGTHGQEIMNDVKGGREQFWPRETTRRICSHANTQKSKRLSDRACDAALLSGVANVASEARRPRVHRTR